jgi:hypothetical protein
MKLIEVDIVESVDEFGRSARSEVPSRRLGLQPSILNCSISSRTIRSPLRQGLREAENNHYQLPVIGGQRGNFKVALFTCRSVLPLARLKR